MVLASQCTLGAPWRHPRTLGLHINWQQSLRINMEQHAHLPMGPEIKNLESLEHLIRLKVVHNKKLFPELRLCLFEGSSRRLSDRNGVTFQPYFSMCCYMYHIAQDMIFRTYTLKTVTKHNKRHPNTPAQIRLSQRHVHWIHPGAS